MSEHKTLTIEWSTEDIISQAHDMGVDLDIDQAYEILEQVIDDHDASVGINWDVIEYHISDSEYYIDELIDRDDVENQ